MPDLEFRADQRLLSALEDQQKQIDKDLSQFQKQLELSQETDTLRYQLWLKEQPTPVSVQEHCKPLFQSLNQLVSASNKQVYSLTDKVNAIQSDLPIKLAQISSELNLVKEEAQHNFEEAVRLISGQAQRDEDSSMLMQLNDLKQEMYQAIIDLDKAGIERDQ